MTDPDFTNTAVALGAVVLRNVREFGERTVKLMLDRCTIEIRGTLDATAWAKALAAVRAIKAAKLAPRPPVEFNVRGIDRTVK